jgi:hypothetical protein
MIRNFQEDPYRNPDFSSTICLSFDAKSIVCYLHELGISDCYAALFYG